MIATRLPDSWEKQILYSLSNGFIAIVEFGFYGYMITALYNDTQYWQCSDGLSNLPKFAHDWVDDGIVRLSHAAIKNENKFDSR